MKNLIDILDLSTALSFIAKPANIRLLRLCSLNPARAPVFPLKLQCLNSAEEFSDSPKQAQVPLQKVKESATPLRL